MYQVYQPYKLYESKKYILKCIDDDWISWTGEYVKKCEQYLSEKLDIKHVLLINNGTAGCHCLVKAIKWKNPKCKKIYLPNYCYVSAYNMTLIEFPEEQIEILPIDTETWNMKVDLNKLEKNSAIIVIHNLGNIIPLDDIKEKRPDIILVEDNCEGFMGKYGNKFSGSNSLASCLSFFANKHITSGEGGAFMTNDSDLFEYIKKFARQGQTSTRYLHDRIGFNYRMSNLDSALLWSQLLLLDEIMIKKERIYNDYKKYLKNKVIFQKIEPNTKHSYWMVSVRIKNNKFQDLKKFMNSKKVDIRQFFYEINKHKHLEKLKVLEKSPIQLENEIIILPSYPDLTEKDVEYISNSLLEFVSTIE
jgi:perosamine synthetase